MYVFTEPKIQVIFKGTTDATTVHRIRNLYLLPRRSTETFLRRNPTRTESRKGLHFT